MKSMNNIKDLLKEHLRVEIGHPRRDWDDYENDIEIQIYWDDELIIQTDSISRTL